MHFRVSPPPRIIRAYWRRDNIRSQKRSGMEYRRKACLAIDAALGLAALNGLGHGVFVLTALAKGRPFEFARRMYRSGTDALAVASVLKSLLYYRRLLLCENDFLPQETVSMVTQTLETFWKLGLSRIAGAS